jgi:hypothetical protein
MFEHQKEHYDGPPKKVGRLGWFDKTTYMDLSGREEHTPLVENSSIDFFRKTKVKKTRLDRDSAINSEEKPNKGCGCTLF